LSWSYGTQQNIGMGVISNIRMALPPMDEQKAIARFLDYKTAQIDALIAKKEALLTKLAEKRTALISHAVTKGLDPSVPMKDSGVEWLGEIPAHWQAKKVKYFATILRGKFSHRPRNDPRFYGGEYPFIQTGDVARADKYIEEFSQTLNDEGLKVSKEFPSGTLVMTIAANIGDMAILNFDACFPDSIVGFVPKSDVELNFLYYMFTAMRQQLLSTAVLNTQLNLNIERIGDQFGAFPPTIEQIKIAEYLDEVVLKMANQACSISNAIIKLQEYRSALITNAVTGKIDVRDFKIPPTPQEAAHA
jgi:type I restriction enzyme S subunit